jgi:hypothetical protein
MAADGAGEILVHPPDSLLKYEPPVFVGLEPSKGEGEAHHAPGDSKQKDAGSQLDDMLNSMLPPR